MAMSRVFFFFFLREIFVSLSIHGNNRNSWVLMVMRDGPNCLITDSSYSQKAAPVRCAWSLSSKIQLFGINAWQTKNRVRCLQEFAGQQNVSFVPRKSYRK